MTGTGEVRMTPLVGPLDRQRGVYPWEKIAQAMREETGPDGADPDDEEAGWLLLVVLPYKGMATRLRRGDVRAFQTGRWEFFEQKERGTFTYNLYGRYLGPDQTEDGE